MVVKGGWFGERVECMYDEGVVVGDIEGWRSENRVINTRHFSEGHESEAHGQVPFTPMTRR
jgi:hypothetical protein